MIDLTELLTELTGDPEALGYTGDDVEDAATLNEVQAAIQLNRESIPMGEVYGKIVWADFIALSADRREAFRIITSTPDLDVRSQNIRDAFVAIFGGGSATLTNLQGILKRPASRAEELWGAGAYVTPSLCADARRL